MKILSLPLAFLLGLGLTTLRAQDAVSRPTSTPTPTPVPSAESIVVVGTNLPEAEETGPDPIIAIDREQIDKAGERTAADFLRNLTVSGPNGLPTSNNNAGFAPGASSISLRGFDPGLTLVLIDGKRVANYPIGINGVDSFVDLNSIPAAAIAGIDILTDTASAEFGADAVAGVVNIRLRHDYRGAEADLEYGNTLNKDSSEFSSALIFGVGNGNTEISGALDYYHRNSIANHDRAYSAVTFHPSINTSPPYLELSRAAVLAAGGNPAPDLGDDFFARPPFFNHGNAPASGYNYTTNPARDFNFNAYSTAVPDSEKYGGFINLTHRIFGDQMVLAGDLFYQDVRTHYLLAPSATGPFQTPGQTTLAIPPHAPGATLDGLSDAETGVPVGAFNPFNPFQQIISGFSFARLSDFGNRENDAETKAWFSTIELKGDKLFDGHRSYDASFRYSEVDNTSGGTFVSAARFDRALNAADPIFNPASQQYIGTTIPYNPFGDFRVPIPSNAPSIAYATIHPVENDYSNLVVADFDLRSSELLTLPAGGVSLNLGAQFRRESIEQDPDKFFIAGDIVGTTPGSFVEAHRTAAAAYAELDIPVFASSFNIPGFRALDFTAALRFEEFADNLNNAVVPKFGLRWQPFDESLTIRATLGEGFYEPTLFELHGNPSSGVADMLFDPVKGADVFEIPTVLRSNPALQPGDSRNYSCGIICAPAFVPGLTLSADFFNIETTGRVNVPDPQTVLDRAALGQSAPGEQVFRDANGNLQLIEFAYQNGGSQQARGIDFELRYQFDTRCGTFTSLTRASYLGSFRFADLPGDPEKELSNSAPFNSDDPYLRWRANSQVEWSWRNLDTVFTCHYLDGFHEIVDVPAFSGEHWVAARALFDLQMSYRFALPTPHEDRPVPGYSRPVSAADGAKPAPAHNKAVRANTSSLWRRLLKGTTLTLGVNNLFGQDPPVAFGGGSGANYPANIYDSTGRFLYASVKKKF